MIKRLLKTVSVLIIIALVLAGIFFYSIFVSVENLTVSYHTVQSEKIPADMNDIQIAFITDLEYNHFMNKDRLTKMIHKINEVKPDIVLFGGDIFVIFMLGVGSIYCILAYIVISMGLSSFCFAK